MAEIISNLSDDLEYFQAKLKACRDNPPTVKTKRLREYIELLKQAQLAYSSSR